MNDEYTNPFNKPFPQDKHLDRLNEVAKFLEDFDELTGKQAAYIVRHFDPKTECYHLRVEIRSRCVAPETRYDPAEYEQKAHCQDCGEWLEVEDVPDVATRRDA